MDILSTFQEVCIFRMKNHYAFGPLGTCEKDTYIIVDFQNTEKVQSLLTCFTNHMLQNKELFSLKQWHLRICYTDRNVSFNSFKQYSL